jgi:hypothetical protein
MNLALVGGEYGECSPKLSAGQSGVIKKGRRI